ncbi:hypothetical protein ACFQ7M_32705 [Streptomyces massasporeus]
MKHLFSLHQAADIWERLGFRGLFGTATDRDSRAVLCGTRPAPGLLKRRRSTQPSALWSGHAEGLTGPGATLPALVGFWRQDYSNPQVLHVINRNSFDLDNVTVRFNDGYFIRVGLVPSCQAWTLAGFTVPGAQANSTYTLQFPARLDFEDQHSSPRRWTITDDPPHRQKTPPSLPSDKDLTNAFRQQMVGPYFAGCAA